MHFWYNPVEEEEAECIAQDPVARQSILNTLRIGPHDCSDVRLRVPLAWVDEVKVSVAMHLVVLSCRHIIYQSKNFVYEVEDG